MKEHKRWCCYWDDQSSGMCDCGAKEDTGTIGFPVVNEVKKPNYFAISEELYRRRKFLEEDHYD